MLTCLYLTGILFMTDGSQFTAIGPTTQINYWRGNIEVRNFSGSSVSFPWDREKPLVPFLKECEAEAVAKAMEEEGF